MGVTLSELQGKQRELEVEYYDSKIKIVYNPWEINSEFWNWAISGDATDAEMVARAVKSWDILDESKQVVPPSQELIDTFPVALVGALARKLTDDFLFSVKQARTEPT